MNPVLNQIASDNNIHLVESNPLSGGDINDVFLLKSHSEKYVVKINRASKFPGMFKAEALGLHLLKSTESFLIPRVIKQGLVEDTSYILLEYIAPGSPSSSFWQDFTTCLTKLHKKTHSKFGLDHANYIGSLPQYNDLESSASEFYINQRLEPQFKIATSQGFNFSEIDRFYKTIEDEIPMEASSLIHGDLWSGNYLVSSDGKPVLIDPAVAYAPREMDISMMHLFGGFPSEVYSFYSDLFPLAENWKQRIRIWQLYYLLVHLNLFGSGYLSQVNSILKHYS